MKALKFFKTPDGKAYTPGDDVDEKELSDETLRWYKSQGMVGDDKESKPKASKAKK